MNAFVNEFHYDNAGGDVGEFIEIAGLAGTDLTGWSLVLYNGSNSEPYRTEALSGVLADENNGFGFLVVDLPVNGLQNGSPDGIALVDDTGAVVEFLSYEGAFTATAGPAAGMTSTDIGVSEPGTTPIGFSLQREGTGTLAGDFMFTAAQAETKGAANTGQTFDGDAPAPAIVINEVDSDQTGTDSAEFIELFDGGAGGTSLDGLVLVLFNGNGDASYRAIDLAGFTTDENGFFVVGSAEVPNVDLALFTTNGVQNGADAVALYRGTAADFPNGTAPTTEGLVDAVVYGTSDADDAGLLAALGLDVQLDEDANGAKDTESLSRIPDGGDFVAQAPTPGESNGGAPVFVINEVDSDQTGTDSAEFIEIYDGGVGGASLDGLVVVLFNGNGDAAYDAIDLTGQVTDENGFFVIGSADVPNVDLVAFTTNGLQNGADAVALYAGAAADFPSGTPATTENLIDAIVYDTNDADDAGLLAALGQTVQFNEDENGAKDTESLSRVPDGGDIVAKAPTPGESNDGGVVAPLEVLISEIQGSSDFSALPGPAQITVDDRSALEGRIVTISAIVTADFQSGANGVIGSDLSGFFVQEEDADWDDEAFTSEGLFIFDDFADGNPDVQVGDLVEITGTVQEFFGQTQLTADSVTVVASNQMLPSVTVIDYGTTGAILDDDGEFVVNLEAFEGMRISIPEAMTVTEMFNLDRFGEYRVSSEGRLEQFTQNNAPSVEGFAAHLESNAARSLVLDDGRTGQNPDELEIIDGNNGVLDADDSFRMGDEISNLEGVVAYGFDEFRLHDAKGDYQAQNPRPESPEDIGGTFKVASLNVLNYFTTIDDGSNNSGPNNDQGARGADSPEEFERQANKIVQAIIEIDSDIVGLVELENDDDEAIADLVARVNAELGSEVYAFIATGDLGGDAITNGLIYKQDKVAPKGDFAALLEFEGQSFLDPLNAGRDLNRPALAQTFTDLESGTDITVAVNHFKSKGSLSGLPEDEAQGDGQGNNNATRTEAAKILADWLASDPTGTGAEKQLILGDLNAYAQEDPLTALADAGFSDLAQELIGEDAYSFVFDGQIGTLDYILANEAIRGDVAGITEWHINADEADAIDYNLDFGRDPTLYNPDTPARNSDHDPVIVSFNFTPMVLGTDRGEKLFGTEAGEIINGLGGRDKLFGLGGADTFVLNDGDRDKVRDFSFEEGDRLDVSEWGVQNFDELKITGGRTAVVSDRESGNKATVKIEDKGFKAGDLTAENFVFAPVEDLVLVGDRGFDHLKGRAGNDVLDGQGGFNILTGRGGDDTFVLSDGSFNRITDFGDGADLIDVSDWGATGIDDLHIFGRGHFVVVSDGKNKAFVSLEEPLTEYSFIFAPDTLV